MIVSVYCGVGPALAATAVGWLAVPFALHGAAAGPSGRESKADTTRWARRPGRRARAHLGELDAPAAPRAGAPPRDRGRGDERGRLRAARPRSGTGIGGGALRRGRRASRARPGPARLGRRVARSRRGRRPRDRRAHAWRAPDPPAGTPPPALDERADHRGGTDGRGRLRRDPCRVRAGVPGRREARTLRRIGARRPAARRGAASPARSASRSTVRTPSTRACSRSLRSQRSWAGRRSSARSPTSASAAHATRSSASRGSSPASWTRPRTRSWPRSARRRARCSTRTSRSCGRPATDG